MKSGAVSIYPLFSMIYLKLVVLEEGVGPSRPIDNAEVTDSIRIRNGRRGPRYVLGVQKPVQRLPSLALPFPTTTRRHVAIERTPASTPTLNDQLMTSGASVRLLAALSAPIPHVKRPGNSPAAGPNFVFQPALVKPTRRFFLNHEKSITRISSQ